MQCYSRGSFSSGITLGIVCREFILKGVFLRVMNSVVLVAGLTLWPLRTSTSFSSRTSMLKPHERMHYMY